MFFFGDFIEPARDADAAPWRWRWPPGGAATIRFGARAAKAASGRLRFSFSPVAGAWTTLDAEPVAGAPDGHQLWRARIEGPAEGGGCVYEFGYRDDRGRDCWSGRRRALLFSDAPAAGDGAVEVAVGTDADGAVFGPAPALAMTPAPSDWPARAHYALLVDRFAIGAPKLRGLGLAGYDPASPFAAHGGDLQGAIDKLDYLADLGVGALIVSPLLLNGCEGYHGYHPIDLYAVEPRLGDMDRVRELVREAHRRDIAVVLDMVVNHIAPSIVWRRHGDSWRGVFRYDLAEAGHAPLSPDGLRDARFFHDPDHDGDDVTGRLFGFLDDWKTERPDIAAALVRSLKYWLAETNVDGFRFDAVRHVDPAFWQAAARELRRYAATIGKAGFRLYGEHSSHLADVVDAARRNAGFDGMIDYPLYYPIRDAMGGEASGFGRLAARMADKAGSGDLVFIENHDSDRALGRLAAAMGDVDLARQASLAWLTLLLLGPDTPIIAQGQEQEFQGRLRQWTTPDGQDLISDAYVREDMFPNPDCVWRFGPVNAPTHPPYDRTNPTWRTIAELSRLRRALPALSAGPRRALRHPDDGRYFWEVGQGGNALLLAVNLTDAPIDLALDRPVGTQLFQTGRASTGAEVRLGPYAAGLWEWPTAR